MMRDFEAISASDPRVCIIVSNAGIVQGLNPPAQQSIPDIQIGSDFGKLCLSPEALQKYLSLCLKTRGPLPGKIALADRDGQVVEWSCHGGLLSQAKDKNSLIILRLQPTQLGKSAFANLNREIKTLNAEVAWRAQADRATAHLAAIVSSSTDAIYSKDLNKIVTSWNRGSELMFSYTAEEMIGASILPVVPTDKLAEEDQLLQRLRKGETLAPIETLRKTRDGKLIDVSITSSSIKDHDGNIVGYSKILRDISSRKQVEHSLRAANETFEHLVNQSPFGVYAVDADFHIAMVSTGALKAFTNVHPLIGRDFAEAMRILWPETAATEFIARFQRTLETGEPYHAPTLIETRNDTAERESYDWKIERMTLPDGRLGVVCHFYDLSERQRYEAALKQSEERFRGTFENTSVGIAHVGLEGDWLEINDQLCNILEYSREELLEQPLKTIRHADDEEANLELVAKLLLGELPSFQNEERYIKKDGSIVHVSVSADLQLSDTSNHPYFIYVVIDITRRKMVQEHQNFLMQELAHRTKNQLAVISAMARQTAKNAESIRHFRSVFEPRLHGLGVSIDLLVKGGWSGASLRQLVERQVAAFKGDDGRLCCEGPDITLDSVAAESIGLALHELSTNCLKYGAWSHPSGIVSISWEVSSGKKNERLKITSVESGGPIVTAPSRTGFGQTVIQRLVAQKLGIDVELSYPTDGVNWTVLLPSRHYSVNEK